MFIVANVVGILLYYDHSSTLWFCVVTTTGPRQLSFDFIVIHLPF